MCIKSVLRLVQLEWVHVFQSNWHLLLPSKTLSELYFSAFIIFFFFHALLGSPLGIALRFAIHVTAKLCAGSPAETDSAYGRRNIIDR